MKGFELLSEENVFGENKYDFGENISNPNLTGFAFLTGAALKSRKNCPNVKGYWWLKDCANNGTAIKCVNPDGEIITLSPGSTICGVRPLYKLSTINFYFGRELNSENNWIKFGEFPRSIVKASNVCVLEQEYKKGKIVATNQTFTTFEEERNSGKYIPVKHQVLCRKIGGYKYIRYEACRTFYDTSNFLDKEIIKGNTYWVTVEPLVWFIDKKNDVAVTRDIIFSGIPYDNVRLNERTNGYDDSFIKQYLDLCFAEDLISSMNRTVIKNSYNQEENIYGFDLNKVSEEDIIRGAIESDISVFLHGKSSDGKSQRIKKLDPDCEIIYMRNATPDSLNGKSVYDSSRGSMIDVPPTWYKKVVDKCTKEPDKIHLVFFDELTNALPSMQGMAFNIILDREVNGKWKLPKNARIVAAGNDLGDSLAANKMAEPLFNRFAHVYINTEVEDWLKWAMEEEEGQRIDYEEFEPEDKIHPAIISYIEHANYVGYDALRTDFDGVMPNADPRKWEMASKVLYKTNKPEMLRALVGEELTRDFISYVIRSSRKKVKKL